VTGDTDIAALAALLADTARLLVFTGAGISTGSGIPDYRGPQGIWKTRQPIYYQDFMRSAGARNAYWQQKLEDRGAFAAARPNAVHHAVVDLERSGRVELVVTQNVDGLHAAAGTTEAKLVEIHGTNRLIECQSCGERSAPGPHFSRFAADGQAPLCRCGGYLKSATISFGQNLRAGDLDRAYRAAARCDAALVLGSSLVVNPAASIPLYAAERGVPYAIVNRGFTGHDELEAVTLRIDRDVAEVVPVAVAAVLGAG
jgi:NAD-dependent deacetylase